MSRKRTNPNRVLVTITEADKKRLVANAMTEATEAAIAIFFTVMLDKHQYTAEMLHRSGARSTSCPRRSPKVGSKYQI